jgi:acyl-coenzyme A synthetase/AMP-(fatty) acid ligase
VLKPSVTGEQAVLEALRDIQSTVNDQVSGYKRLRGGVWHIDALPKNATGKILRKEMTAMTSGICSLDTPHKAKL